MVPYQQEGYIQQVRRADTAKNLILLVEDDEVTASLLCQVIQQETPYQIAHTSDGITAWKFLQYVRPQLVILDYRLPGMDGIQLYDNMRLNSVSHDIPVLLLSAVPPTREIVQRKIVSLQKPFDLDKLLHTIDMLLTF
jgi:DNA-binding response OmpR family regulator